MVHELDYTGYPVTDLEAGEHFYSKVLGLGKPYEDTDYWGWWSNFGVFGIYLTNPEEDQLPKPARCNGYVSFWVSSAKEAQAYAAKHGSSFPVIGAINSQAGITKEPGYTQLYTTDSEGNGLLFTQYP